jgi:hypothetical protein
MFTDPNGMLPQAGHVQTDAEQAADQESEQEQETEQALNGLADILDAMNKNSQGGGSNSGFYIGGDNSAALADIKGTDIVQVSFVSVDPNNGNIEGGTIRNEKVLDNGGVINAAATPYGPRQSQGKVGAIVSGPGIIYDSYFQPAHGSPYDGIVAIGGTANFVEPNPKTCINDAPKSRSNLAFHEMWENFYRVVGDGKKGFGYPQAHLEAVGKEMDLPLGDPRRSQYPGVAGLKK